METIVHSLNTGFLKLTADKAINIFINNLMVLRGGCFTYLASFINPVDPAKIVKLVSEHEVAAQQSVSLDCQAEGNLQPTYLWTPCGTTCDPQQCACHKSVLTFQTSNKSVYMFTCKVANNLGSDARNTSLCKLVRTIFIVHKRFSFCNDISFHEDIATWISQADLYV